MVRVLLRFQFAWLLVWASLVGAGCSRAAPPIVCPSPPAELRQTLRVATYNINFGNRALPEVAQAIRESGADVVCLQETNPDSAEFLSGEFSAVYPHRHFTERPQRYAAEGFGILSKWPLAKVELLPAEHGLFGALVAEVQVSGTPIQVVNVHLQPVLVPAQRRAGDWLGALVAFQKAETIHEREMAAILAHVAVDRPTIVAGDFNSGATFQAPKLTVKHGMIDSFASVQAEPESHPTWHWPLSHGEISLRIDYLFHSPHLRTIESRVIRTEASDHWLVVSQLELIPQSARKPE